MSTRTSVGVRGRRRSRSAVAQCADLARHLGRSVTRIVVDDVSERIDVSEFVHSENESEHTCQNDGVHERMTKNLRKVCQWSVR